MSSLVLIKEIKNMIEFENISEAKNELSKNKNTLTKYSDYYSMSSTIAFLEKNYEEAIDIINTGLKSFQKDFDLLYNLACIHEVKTQYNDALELFSNLLSYNNDVESKNDLLQKIQLLKRAIDEGNYIVKGFKVLIICHFFSIYTKEYIEKMNSYFDIKFDVLTMDERYLSDIDSTCINNIYLYRDGKTVVDVLKKIPQCDIGHVHYLEPFYGDLGDLIKQKCNKILLTIWGSDYFRMPEKYKEVQRGIVEKADGYSSNNELTLEGFSNYFKLKKEDLYITRFGLSVIEYIKELLIIGKSEVRKEFEIDENTIVITCGYNGNPAHQHLKIIDSLDKIKDKINAKDVLILFPMTYSRVEEHVQEVKDRFQKLGIRGMFLEKYGSLYDAAKVSVISDIMIQVQTTDSISGTMMEQFYCGNIIITGKWLPYKLLKELDVYYEDVHEIQDISDKLLEIIDNIDVYKLRCKENTKKVNKFASWDNCANMWKEAYLKLFK